MSATARAQLCALLAAGLPCCKPPPAERPVRVELQARGPSGDPVAEVRFWADGRAIGVSEGDGSLSAELAGADGATAIVTAACPPAYRTPVPERRLRLTRLPLGSGRAHDAQLGFLCEPLEPTAAVVVLTDGAPSGLPIEVGGVRVGQTEADGTAHLLLAVRPREALRVVLNTSADPELRPQQPLHTFRVEDQDSIVLVEQRFERSRRRARPRPEPAPAPARRPDRIR